MHPFIETQKEYLREDIPTFRPGDTVRVNVRVREGDKERIQAFEGVCIARKHGGVSETFKVRKVSGGVGVERIFPLHSPSLAGIEVVRRGSVRRAKLYYLRERKGKKARVREKAWWLDAAAEPPAGARPGSEPTGEEAAEQAPAAEESSGAPEDVAQASAEMRGEEASDEALAPDAGESVGQSESAGGEESEAEQEAVEAEERA